MEVRLKLPEEPVVQVSDTKGKNSRGFYHSIGSKP